MENFSVDYDVSFVCGDAVIVGCKVECFVKEVLADGRIELFDVETDEAEELFFEKLYVRSLI